MMDTELSLEPKTTALRSDLSETAKPAMYVTKVHGRAETGITFIQGNSEALFVPDETPENDPIIAVVADRFHSTEPVDVFSLYPHWGDQTVIAGQSIRSVRAALDLLVTNAIGDCASDMESMNVLLLVECHLFEAVETPLNERPLELFLHFCAWSVVNAQKSPIDRSAWNDLASALREGCEHPFMATEKANALIERLKRRGWNGESEASIAFDAAFDLANAETEQAD